jgi:glycerol-3-phosphate dehydrogenase (NAD(P)+)
VQLLLAVPGQYLRGLIRDIAPQIKRPVILLNVAKALEAKTNKFLSEVVTEEMVTAKVPYWFAALSGGMLAEEVTKHWPIAADIACTTESVRFRLMPLLVPFADELDP